MYAYHSTTQEMYLTFGDLNVLKDTHEEFNMTIQKENVILHKGYNNKGHNDVCLIKTPKDIFDSQTPECQHAGCVKIACLPTKPPPIGAACYVAGWGAAVSGANQGTNKLWEGKNYGVLPKLLSFIS